MSLESLCLAAIHTHSMINHGDNVIVALSGGADSMALFHFFCAQRERLQINVAAAHFEHGIRGEESLRDAALVHTACARQGVALYMGSGNMAKSPRPQGQSEEEWARRLRYAFLEELAAEHNASIATAHNQNDNAETVLFHAIRGAGPRGLAGIPPVRGVFIRPLLGVSRGEIEAYCKANSLDYATDSTNKELTYARNRLRLEVLPALERVHHGATAALARQTSDMRQLDDWLAETAHALLLQAAGEGGGTATPEGWQHLPAVSVAAAPLQAAPQPVRLKALALLGGRSTSRERLGQMEAVLAGARRAAQLRKGRKVWLQRGRLHVASPDAQTPQSATEALDYEIPLRTGSFFVPGGYAFSLEIIDLANFDDEFTCLAEKSNKKDLNFMADYDKISECSVVRTRRAGDSFCFARRGVTKPLKKWMNEQALPPKVRASLPLIACQSTVLWIYGVGFAAGVQPHKGTRRLLRVTLPKEEAAQAGQAPALKE